jgi:hypothetical protein
MRLLVGMENAQKIIETDTLFNAPKVPGNRLAARTIG